MPLPDKAEEATLETEEMASVAFGCVAFGAGVVSGGSYVFCPGVLVGVEPVPLLEAGGKMPPKRPSLPKRPPAVLVLDGVGVDDTAIVLVKVVDSPTKMTGVEDSVVFVGRYE